jgi:hypothetical protein
MPMEPTLRPDLTASWAWVGLALSGFLAYVAHTMSGRVKARFEQALYGVSQRAREQAAARGISLETDLGEAYPSILISRQHRVVSIVGPHPLIVGMDQIEVDVAKGGLDREAGAPRQSHLVLRLKNNDPEKVFVISGRGLARSNLAQVVVLAERLKDFIDTGVTWENQSAKAVDVAAFIESMRVR